MAADATPHVRAEAAVAELADLVADLRDGGFIERGRILARGARLLRDLTPKQRRTLAIEVARSAAPQLVERITAEGGAAGDVDLSPAQVKAVFDMVARLDEEGAGDLAARLRDPDWQRDALGLLATDGLDAVAESAGIDEADAIFGAEGDGVATDDESSGSDADQVALPDEEEAAALAQAAWDPDGGDNIGSELEPHGPGPNLGPPPDRQEIEAEVARRQAEAEQPPEFAGPPPTYEPTLPELAAYEPTGIDPALLSFGATTSPGTAPAAAARAPSDRDVGRSVPTPSGDPAPPTHRAPDDRDHGRSVPASEPRGPEAAGSERSWFADADLGVPPVEAEATPLFERLLALERPSHRLRLLNVSVLEVANMDTDEQVGVLRALPDGWVRRRALHRLLDAHGISRSGAPRLLQTLGHDIDRAWVAASMIEAELVHLDDVTGLLSDRAAARLRGRYTTTEV